MTPRALYFTFALLLLADGTKGRVHENRIEPSIVKEMLTERALFLLPDTVNRGPDSRSRITISKSTRVIQLIRTPRWGKIRTAEGDEGWVWQAYLVHKDAVPAATGPNALYRLFKKVDDLRALHPIVSLIVFILQWFVLLLAPGMVVFLLCYQSLGRVRLLNNGMLKLLIGIAVLAAGLFFIGRIIPSIPPFIGTFSAIVARFLAGAMLVGVLIGALDRVSEDRCPKCHRIGAGTRAGMRDAGKTRLTETTTTLYRDGHRTVQQDITDTHSFAESRQCRFCGHRWAISRSSRNTSRTLR